MSLKKNKNKKSTWERETETERAVTDVWRLLWRGVQKVVEIYISCLGYTSDCR